jgi:hypothetical protein
LPSSFSTILSSALVCSTSPPVSVWGTVYKLGLFPGTPSKPRQSIKPGQHTAFVTSSRPWNINQVPIGYGCRPRLRGRLTLRGLTLRRNPWTFGGSVSRTPFRYSCQHSHFRCLQQSLRITFAGLRNAPLPVQKSEDRSQKSEILRFIGLATCAQAPAASSRSIDIRLANAARSPRRYSRGPGHSGPRPAFRRSSPSPSADTA